MKFYLIICKDRQSRGGGVMNVVKYSILYQVLPSPLDLELFTISRPSVLQFISSSSPILLYCKAINNNNQHWITYLLSSIPPNKGGHLHAIMFSDIQLQAHRKNSKSGEVCSWINRTIARNFYWILFVVKT